MSRFRPLLGAALALAIALTGSASLALVASDAGAAPKKPDLSGETIAVGDQLGGIKAGLAAAGLLDNIPYKVDWSTFSSGPPLVEALNAGSIDFGLVGDVPPVFAAVSDVDLNVVGAVRTNPAAQGLLVAADSPIKKLADLKGKKVAFGEGTSAQFFILQALKKAGLTLDDIEPVNLATVDARAAGLNGNVDAWVSNDPLITLDTTNNDARVLLDGASTTSGLILYVARGEAIKDKRAVLNDFVARIAESRNWAREHPDLWAQAWSKEIGLPVAVLEAVARQGNYHAVPVDKKVIADIQKIADVFFKAGLIPEKVNVKKVFNTSFNSVLGKAPSTATSTTTTTSPTAAP
jgi:sulfonate transport system substrate-binding protein